MQGLNRVNKERAKIVATIYCCLSSNSNANYTDRKYLAKSERFRHHFKIFYCKQGTMLTYHINSLRALETVRVPNRPCSMAIAIDTD